MTIYIWLAAMGVVGLIALLLFIYFLSRDLKLRKSVKVSVVALLPNWLLLVLSVICFSMMVYFFLDVKEQLVQLTS